MLLKDDLEGSCIASIIELAEEIAEECPACAARASEIIVWAKEIRERRPSADELAALIDTTCGTSLREEQRAMLIQGLRALVRFAE